MNIPNQLLLGSALLALAAHTPAFAVDDVSVRVETGDTSAFAIGENASSRISLGGLPTTGGKGCAQVNVKVGNVQKIAIGPNATAVVEIPARSIHCGEKQP